MVIVMVMAGTQPDGSLPAALISDPPLDKVFPAQTLPKAIPSHGVNLNAVFYTAAGAGPHPTILLLHGLPGNEQNLDLAQSMRRAGWHVLTLHYRGSWGSPGVFSFTHCLEDAAAAMDWLRDPEAHRISSIDTRQIVVIGHSMGGFVAADVAGNDQGIMGAGLISGVDLRTAFGALPEHRAAEAVDENMGTSAGLHILSGTSPEALAEEAQRNSGQWSLVRFTDALAERPLLLVTSDDGFASGSDALADSVEAARGGQLSRIHFPTDHSYSDHRIALQAEVLRWLTRVRLYRQTQLALARADDGTHRGSVDVAGGQC